MRMKAGEYKCATCAVDKAESCTRGQERGGDATGRSFYLPSLHVLRGAMATTPLRQHRSALPDGRVGRAFLAKPSWATNDRIDKCA